MSNNKKIKISILIPCYNESKVIAECLESCLNQTRKPDQILVVDDGSKDNTYEVASKFPKPVQVIRIPKNTGNKSRVQEYGLKYINGDVFVSMDADTKLDPDFIRRVDEGFHDTTVASFCGYVKSSSHNWITSFREFEYYIGQFLHKFAQSEINAIVVIPGCAAAYRVDVFKKYCSFDHDTLTEDMDFTFKLHKNNQKIIYDPLAIVHTQDPHTLKQYINQMRRWYSGGWQNLIKHKDIFRKLNNAIELTLVYSEGAIFGIVLFLLPFYNINLYFNALLFTLILFVFTSFYIAILDRRIDIFIYSPLYLIILHINAWLFISEFIREIILRNKRNIWYHVERRAVI